MLACGGWGDEKSKRLDLEPDFYQIAQDAKHTGGKAETYEEVKRTNRNLKRHSTDTKQILKSSCNRLYGATAF